MKPTMGIPPQGESKTQVPDELRGDTISYAIQHVAHNALANFYEPAIDSYLQKRYYERHKNGAQGYGNYSQNLAGQFVGDVVGGGALIAAELLIPNQLHTVTRAARRAIDPLYDSVARWVLADQRDKPDYQQQVLQWKTYQERSLVRSGIMTAAAVAGNVAVQKAVGNPSPLKVVFGTKLISTAVTAVLTLTSRLMFPDQTRKLDNLINRKIVTPLLQQDAPDSPGAHTSKLLNENSKNMFLPAR
jgi:hypothetical protein